MTYYNKFPNLMRSFAPETLAYLGAMGTALDLPRAIIVDDFVKKLIKDGLWSKFDVLTIHAMQTEQQGRLNLVAPVGSLDELSVVGSAPTFTAGQGFTTTGNLSNRLATKTNYSTFSKFLQNSASFGAWSDPSQLQNAICMGTSDSQNILAVNHTGGNQYGRINMSSNSSTSAGGGGNGLHVMNRSGSAAYEMYYNGSSFSTGTTASVARTATPFNVLNSGASFTAASTTVLRLSFIGESMDATEQSNFYNAVNTLITTIG